MIVKCSDRKFGEIFRKVGTVGIIEMQGHNITPPQLKLITDGLDEVENNEEYTAVILSADAREKIWCWGIDPAWALEAGHDATVEVFLGISSTIGRLMSFPVPTIACITGHCIGGGALLALGCDYRVMRSDRMFFNLDAIDRNMSFSLPMSKVVRAKLSHQTLRDLVLKCVKP
jgi:enoyl-CoA hydratase/carnithine racemase